MYAATGTGYTDGDGTRTADPSPAKRSSYAQDFPADGNRIWSMRPDTAYAAVRGPEEGRCPRIPENLIINCQQS